jgi:hypothetical protein
VNGSLSDRALAPGTLSRIVFSKRDQGVFQFLAASGDFRVQRSETDLHLQAKLLQAAVESIRFPLLLDLTCMDAPQLRHDRIGH